MNDLEKAEGAGYRAHRDGLLLAECPYCWARVPTGRWLRLAWRRGYLEREDSFRRSGTSLATRRQAGVL
jgi:hypothetical protein